jgi:hypothetical protein
MDYDKTQVALDSRGSCTSADGTVWKCDAENVRATVTLVSRDSFDMSIEIDGYLRANIDTSSCTSAIDLDLYSVSLSIATHSDSTNASYTFSPRAMAENGNGHRAEFVNVGTKLNNVDAITCCPSIGNSM